MSFFEEQSIMVDASVILPLLRGNRDGRRIEDKYRLSVRSGIHLSAVTMAEVEAFACYNHWGADKILSYEQFVGQAFIINVIDREIIQAYIEFYCLSQKRGKGIGQNDLWLAATARAYDLTLLTADSDFRWIPSDLLKIEFFQPGMTP